MTRRRPRTWRAGARRCIWIALLCTGGCATASLPVRYPSHPPAGMSPASAEQDQQDCLAVAGRAKVERAWAYIGCMVSKGHSVGVAFHVQGHVTHLDATQVQPHDAAAASRDLEECRRSAYTAGRAQGGAREGVVSAMETTFRTCLAPLGYTVEKSAAATPKR